MASLAILGNLRQIVQSNIFPPYIILSTVSSWNNGIKLTGESATGITWGLRPSGILRISVDNHGFMLLPHILYNYVDKGDIKFNFEPAAILDLKA